MTSGAETDCSAHSSGPARRTADVAAAADGDDRHGHDAAFDGVRKRRSDPRKCATRPHSDRAPAEVRRRAGSTDRRPVWSRWAFRRSPGHARVERCTRYVIFRPKRPSEAPGSPRKRPGSPRDHPEPPRNRPQTLQNARKCPPVFPFVPACLRALFSTLQILDTMTLSECKGRDAAAPPRVCCSL